jgi:uncharacterized protein
MARITHFDIYVKDVDRAEAFYKTCFDWRLEKWDGPMEYWFVFTGEDGTGINGGLSVGEPSLKGAELTLEVDSFDGTAEKVKQAGGSLVREKDAIPGIGWFGSVQDTEGNVFGLMEEDSQAK